MNIAFALWMGFIHKVIMYPFLRLIIGGEYLTNKSLRENKQFIIVANHSSHVDTAALLGVLPFFKVHKVFPVAAKDYFGKNFITKTFFKLTMNTLLIERKCSKQKADSISVMIDALDKGNSLIIFPEGSRVLDEGLQKFKSGVIRVLSQRPEVVFIPAYVKDSSRILPKGDPFVVPHNFKMAIGQAYKIDPSKSDEENLSYIRNKVIEVGELI